MAGKPRAKMPVSERAKQFSSFKALSGLDAALEKKRRELGWLDRKTLSEDDEAKINSVLCELKKGDKVRLEVYVGGAFDTSDYTVIKTDELEKLIYTDKGVIRFGNISDAVKIL